ncbi:hypothetical protein FWK35_00005385, partial [Aphis craccivora]
MTVANRKASLLTNKAFPTSKASTLNAMTLSMAIFIIMAAIMGPILLCLPDSVKSLPDLNDIPKLREPSCSGDADTTKSASGRTLILSARDCTYLHILSAITSPNADSSVYDLAEPSTRTDDSSVEAISSACPSFFAISIMSPISKLFFFISLFIYVTSFSMTQLDTSR